MLTHCNICTPKAKLMENCNKMSNYQNVTCSVQNFFCVFRGMYCSWFLWSFYTASLPVHLMYHCFLLKYCYYKHKRPAQPLFLNIYYNIRLLQPLVMAASHRFRVRSFIFDSIRMLSVLKRFSSRWSQTTNYKLHTQGQKQQPWNVKHLHECWLMLLVLYHYVALKSNQVLVVNIWMKSVSLATSAKDFYHSA